MNEIQIIQSQLATERLHFAEVADACAAALQSGAFAASRDFVAACADYFAFAAARVAWNSSPPGPDAPVDRWREFLDAFNDRAAAHFGSLEQLLGRNLPVSEWRAISRIDADSIFTERAYYGRVKATVP
jgi:hypothetical protein